MANIFNRLFNRGEKTAQDKKPQVKTDDAYQHIVDDQPLNPYSEVRLLQGHSHSVYEIANIDDKRFVTVSEDHLAIVWDAETGCQLQSLQGHAAAVCCVLPLKPCADKCLIMTASMDNSMRLWELNEDECILREEGPCRKVITAHGGPVKCLTQLSHNMLCSGGQDLCVWDRSGHLLSKCDRSQLQETSHIHSIVKLDGRHFGVVAASHYKSLAVYDIHRTSLSDTDRYQLQFVRYLLSGHSEPICCLTSISSSFFASGSLDGVILLWSTNNLSPMKMFHCMPHPPRELATPTSSKISCIQVINERYLFAAVGHGFKVYDVIAHEDNQGHPKPLASHTSAHSAPIMSLEYLEERSVLFTASEDHTVRMWGNPLRQKRDGGKQGESVEGQLLLGKSSIERFIGLKLQPPQHSRKLQIPVVPSLLGEFLLHSTEVMAVKEIGEHGLVTCGNDGSIIIWKDGEKEREKRELEMRAFLQGDTSF